MTTIVRPAVLTLLLAVGCGSSSTTPEAPTSAPSADPAPTEAAPPPETSSDAGVLAGYKLYRSDEGRFEVMLPGAPRLDEKQLSTGQIQKLAIAEISADAVIIVGWTPSPPEARNEAGAKESTAGQFAGVPTAKRVKVAGFDAWDYSGNHVSTKAFMRMRYFFTADRMYQILTLGLEDPQAQAVVESFSLSARRRF